jgi:UDP-N-acetylmuramyl tripeptide synthase
MTEKTHPPQETMQTPKTDTAPLPAIRTPRRMRIRAAVAVMAGRATGAAVRRLKVGGGTSLPGLVARAVDPHLSSYLSAQLQHGAVVITGTNGKTTTSGLVAYVLREGGLRVWRNREGSNLARGVASALLMRSSPAGALREGGDASFVFEVDEAAFPQVVKDLGPRIIAITNLFRDQLDRYGEVDIVAERWRDSLKTLPASTTLVLNADDPAVAALADSFGGRVIYFGVEDAPDITEQAERVQAIDTRTCPRCRGALTYSRRFYSHIGHWACAQCDYARPQPAVSARAISLASLERSRFELALPEGSTTVTAALPGLYNVYNALAAAAVGVALGLSPDVIRQGIGRFSPAFGRAERIAVNGRICHILLAKNPTGINEVLRALASDGAKHHLLMLLNDRAADGEDVSWIWDADIEQAPPIAASVITGGSRAYDLALRLKYAGRAPDAVEPDIARALALALERTPVGQTLYVIPTYTAMLAVRGELERQGFAPHYWEQEDA